MARRGKKSPPGVPEEVIAGFSVLDNKGRLSLSKPVRQALGMRPGSTLAYVLVDAGLLLIPQDDHLAALLDHAASVLEEAGLTTQDLLDELPAARAAVVEELYGAAFMAELTRQHAALQRAAAGGAEVKPADEA